MTEPLSSRAAPSLPVTGGWQAAFVDALPDALLAFDMDSGRVVSANPAATRLFGYDAAALPGMHFSSLLPPLTSNPNTPIGRRFPLTGTVAEAEVFCTAGGEEFPCDMLITSVGDGSSQLAVVHLRDVRAREAERTARLEAERKSFENARAESVIRAVDQYMSHVSHELKTPLAVILSSSSMLERYYLRLSDSKREEHFARIQSQVRYLTEFLDNLRFLSHLDSGQVPVRRDECDVAELLQEIVNGYAGHVQAPLFDVQTGGAVGRLYMDGGLWRRIIMHLVSNAVKYGPRGGTVHVSITRRDDGMLETRIGDHGPGLSAEYRAVAFEVFQRGPNTHDTPGGGLGLAIAARCAALQGGTISYNSAPDTGTVFTVLLPVE